MINIITYYIKVVRNDFEASSFINLYRYYIVITINKFNTNISNCIYKFYQATNVRFIKYHKFI